MASENVDSHNATVLRELEVGDLVEFPRSLYSHWGVYIGDGQIVHLTGGDGGSSNAFSFGSVFSVFVVQKACVKIEDFIKVTEGCKAIRNNGKDRVCRPLHPREIVRRAKEMVGEIDYNVLWYNCEHFAAFLRYDKSWSEQVDKAEEMANLGGALAVGVGTALGRFARTSKMKNN